MLRHWWTRAVVGRTSVSNPFQDAEQPDARFELEWRPNVKARLLVVLACLGLWATAVEARLVYLQVFAHESLLAQAQRQQQEFIELDVPRGDVLDRNGQLLAYSVESFNVAVNPRVVTDPAGDARELCAALGDCSAQELANIAVRLGSKARYVRIRSARVLSPDAALRVRDLIARRAKAGQPAVVSLEPQTRRYYPKLDLAAHVVGFVNAEGRGAGGVEWRHDSTISGEKGHAFAYVDGHTNEIFTRVQTPPTPGASVELTIDVALQHITERALQAGIAASGALGGTAIVLGSDTGEILAQASYPTFNPNVYTEFPDEARKNRAVQDVYEPGSTLKIVTGSAAINEGVLHPSTLIDTRPGSISFPGRKKPIREDKGHNYGVLTFEDVLVRSSNVGAVRAGLAIGAERMMRYLRAFGLGQRIAPDYPGESIGLVHPASSITDSALASISMGYQISVTPMQMVSVANVVASGGLLIEPRVLRAVIKDGRREEVEPKVLRRVITPETAATMTAIMEDVVSRGTAKSAALGRYRVAGKTGTSSKAIPGGYSQTDFNVSFVGFVPSERPVFTILVVVDTPRRVPAYGGVVAAPIFKRIAEGALQHAGVPPSINPAPAVIMASGRPAPAPQPPQPPQPTRASAVAPVPTDAAGRPIMPDLRGLTMRDALRAAQALNLSMTADGDGVVVFQTPVAGTILGSSRRGTLQLRRLPVGRGGSER
jgi:cell division protein FtsI/penicillin-binding protein 2